MPIGVIRRNSLAREIGGWGAFFSTAKNSQIATDLTLVLNGGGGPTYGTAYVAAGMKVAFPDLTVAPILITAVAFAGGVPGADVTLTLATGGLSGAVAAGSNVVVGYFPDTALLLETFTSKLNLNKWSTSDFNGTRAKNTTRRAGHREADGSASFMIRPSVNAPLLARPVGYDSVTGATPTNAGALNAAINPGDSTFGSTTLYSVGAVGTGDVVQVTTTGQNECRTVVSKTGAGPYVYTVDKPFVYGHANAAVLNKVVAPFTHTVYSATGVLPSVAFEDYIPYDNRTQANPNGITAQSYYLPGAILKSLKIESQSDGGVKASLDFDAQDKIKLAVATILGIPAEQVYRYDQESVLVAQGALSASSQILRITDTTLELTNDILKVFAKNNSLRAFCLVGGLQEVKGTFKIYEDQASQATFFSALSNDTILAFRWKIADPVTGYSIQFDVPQIVVDEFNDGDFNPGDLVYANISYTSILDTATSGQMYLTIVNGDYLTY